MVGRRGGTLMAVVDVRSLLSDPSTAASADITTDEINALSAELLERDGGGTMYFAAGDYCIQHLPSEQLNQAYRTGTPPGVVDNFHQGGIVLRHNISYVGEPGTRLVWCDGLAGGQGNAVFMSGWVPFIWVPPVGETPGHLVEAVIMEDVAAGSTTFVVHTIDGFVKGTEVMIRLDVYPHDGGDKPEVLWWTFATVEDVIPTPPGETYPRIVLDRPAQVPMALADQFDSRSHVIYKIEPNRRLDNIEVRNFELVVAAGATQPEAGIGLLYARNCRLENLTSTDAGAGIVNVQYSQDISLTNLFVKSASIPDQYRLNATLYKEHAYYGRGLALQSVHGAKVDDVRLEHFEADGLFVEQNSVQVQFTNAYLVNNHEHRGTFLPPVFDVPTYGMVASIQRSDVQIQGLTVEGFGGQPDVLVSTDGGRRRISITDPTLRPVRSETNPSRFTAALGETPTRVLQGGVRHDRVIDTAGTGTDQFTYYYDTPRVWSRAVPLPVSDTAEFTLPDGLIHRGRIYISSKPNGLAVALVNEGSTPIDITGAVTAGQTVDLPSEATRMDVGAEQQVDSDTAEPRRRYLRVVPPVTGSPPGEYLVIQVSCFPYNTPSIDGSRDDHDGGYAQGLERLRSERVLVGDATAAVLSATDENWHDVTFTEGAGDPQAWEVSVAAEPGDLLHFTPSFAVGGVQATSVYFDAASVRTSDVNRWSAAGSGYPAWIARATSVAGVTRAVTGGVTYRVTANDIVGGRAAVRLMFRLSDADFDRHVVVDDDWSARIELVNLGCP